MYNNIYVGWDSREDIAYQVCEHSIRRRSKEYSVGDVVPLKQDTLREQKLYWRDKDKLSSTEFTLTLLVPHINEYNGWAVFCDCDMVWQINPRDLFSLRDNNKAVMVVKHEYEPTESTKMDGQAQLPYPRKNWSSMILWNCSHPKNKALDLETVNTASPSFLHRFEWLDDDDIGELPHAYNWLVGWYDIEHDGEPKILHYTEGGPWFEETRNCEFDHIWKKELINLYTS